MLFNPQVSLTFSSASASDHASRVTLSIPALAESVPVATHIPKNGKVLVTIEDKSRHYEVLFYCNREGASLKTTCWPQGLRVLQPGTTVDYMVTTVEFL